MQKTLQSLAKLVYTSRSFSVQQLELNKKGLWFNHRTVVQFQIEAIEQQRAGTLGGCSISHFPMCQLKQSHKHRRAHAEKVRIFSFFRALSFLTRRNTDLNME